jgi:hypothetical protein
MIESSEQCSTNAYKHQPVPTPLVPVLVPVADVTIWKSWELRRETESVFEEAEFGLKIPIFTG